MAQANTNRTAAAPAAAAGQTGQYLTFVLGAETFAIGIMAIKEIIEYASLTEVPMMPTYVRGVINLRGIIVPIFDLRARFGMGLTTPTKMHVVIIVATGTRTIGLLVDTVSDIISVDPKAIRPVPEMGLPTDDQFLDGLVALEDRMVTLVSLAGLFGRQAALPDPRAAGETETAKAA